MMLFINPRGMMKLRSRKYREILADLQRTVEQNNEPEKQQRKRSAHETFVQTGERVH